MMGGRNRKRIYQIVQRFRMQRNAIRLLIGAQVLTAFLVPSALLAQSRWPGFAADSASGEQLRSVQFPPGVTVLVNAPPPELCRQGNPVRLILYALPNGNSIEQTVGRQLKPGMDWHFGIQHIGAQTRLLRRKDPATTYVVACLESVPKSWPLWRKNTPSSGERIRALVDTLRMLVPGNPMVSLMAHSGGGSLIFGYLNAVDSIPGFVDRIVFLDANYGFSRTEGHDGKMLRWLRADSVHVLMAIAYDDRNIELNGKKVVGPDGGTYRRSLEMVDRFRALGVPLPESRDTAFVTYRSVSPRIVIAVHQNPSNSILHTILVERNGFLYGVTVCTGAETSVGRFWGDIEYVPDILP